MEDDDGSVGSESILKKMRQRLVGVPDGGQPSTSSPSSSSSSRGLFLIDSLLEQKLKREARLKLVDEMEVEKKDVKEDENGVMDDRSIVEMVKTEKDVNSVVAATTTTRKTPTPNASENENEPVAASTQDFSNHHPASLIGGGPLLLPNLPPAPRLPLPPLPPPTAVSAMLLAAAAANMQAWQRFAVAQQLAKITDVGRSVTTATQPPLLGVLLSSASRPSIPLIQATPEPLALNRNHHSAASQVLPSVLVRSEKELRQLNAALANGRATITSSSAAAASCAEGKKAARSRRKSSKTDCPSAASSSSVSSSSSSATSTTSSASSSSSLHHRVVLVPGASSSGRRGGGSRSNAKKYRCDVCEKTFSRSNTLITHKRIHTGEKPFMCEHCGRAFRQPGNLTRHRLTHTTVKPYVCAACGKAFNRASNLHTHARTHSASRDV